MNSNRKELQGCHQMAWNAWQKFIFSWIQKTGNEHDYYEAIMDMIGLESSVGHLNDSMYGFAPGN